MLLKLQCLFLQEKCKSKRIQNKIVHKNESNECHFLDLLSNILTLKIQQTTSGNIYFNECINDFYAKRSKVKFLNKYKKIPVNKQVIISLV